MNDLIDIFNTKYSEELFYYGGQGYENSNKYGRFELFYKMVGDGKLGFKEFLSLNEAKEKYEYFCDFSDIIDIALWDVTDFKNAKLINHHARFQYEDFE